MFSGPSGDRPPRRPNRLLPAPWHSITSDSSGGHDGGAVIRSCARFGVIRHSCVAVGGPAMRARATRSARREGQPPWPLAHVISLAIRSLTRSVKLVGRLVGRLVGINFRLRSGSESHFGVRTVRPTMQIQDGKAKLELNPLFLGNTCTHAKRKKTVLGPFFSLPISTRFFASIPRARSIGTIHRRGAGSATANRLSHRGRRFNFFPRPHHYPFISGGSRTTSPNAKRPKVLWRRNIHMRHSRSWTGCLLASAISARA